MSDAFRSFDAYFCLSLHAFISISLILFLTHCDYFSDKLRFFSSQILCCISAGPQIVRCFQAGRNLIFSVRSSELAEEVRIAQFRGCLQSDESVSTGTIGCFKGSPGMLSCNEPRYIRRKKYVMERWNLLAALLFKLWVSRVLGKCLGRAESVSCLRFTVQCSRHPSQLNL